MQKHQQYLHHSGISLHVKKSDKIGGFLRVVSCPEKVALIPMQRLADNRQEKILKKI